MSLRKRRPALGAFLSAIVLATACASPPEAKAPDRGQEAQPAAPAKTAPRDYREEETSQDSRSTTTTTPATPAMPATPQPGTVPPAPAPQPAMEPADAPRRREAALRAARTEVEQAQRDLETSMTDCAAACRALGSMERATGHLCDLATEHDDRKRCEDAKTAVLRARDRIRQSCGSCPGGPSLDKTAPIPSRP